MNTSTLYKYVDFSYPTSTNAKKFGFYETGCYCVNLAKGWDKAKVVRAFATKEEANDYAKGLQNEWHPVFNQFQTF